MHVLCDEKVCSLVVARCLLVCLSAREHAVPFCAQGWQAAQCIKSDSMCCVIGDRQKYGNTAKRPKPWEVRVTLGKWWLSSLLSHKAKVGHKISRFVFRLIMQIGDGYKYRKHHGWTPRGLFSMGLISCVLLNPHCVPLRREGLTWQTIVHCLSHSPVPEAYHGRIDL